MIRAFKVLVLFLLTLGLAWGCDASSPTGGGDTECATGLTRCSNGCTDLSTDPMNCNACGWLCPQGGVCLGPDVGCACNPGFDLCQAGCVDSSSDPLNCGGCGQACGAGETCTAGACACAAGRQNCGAGCVNVDADPQNCGMCGNACPADQVCSLSACKADCDGGLTKCGQSCIDTNTDADNCGGCGMACDATETCAGGACSCAAPYMACPDGSCQTTCPVDECLPPNMLCPDGSCAASCPVAGCPPGLISDFDDAAVVQGGEGQEILLPECEGRTGQWAPFNDGAGTQTFAIEDGALHTSGSGFGSYVGISVNLVGKGMVQDGEEYNAAMRGFTGLKFKAWQGSGHASPVRFSVSTPFTEDVETGGECTAGCYNHLGTFLYNQGNQDQRHEPTYQLGTTPQEYTICFDRDLYPLFLPWPRSFEERQQTAERILKFQFQFNNAKDMAGRSPSDTTAAPEYAKSLAFDFWVDDVEFVTGECGAPSPFTSTAGTNTTFPRNGDLGSCPAATGSANISANLARAYLRWKAEFIQGNKVHSPEDNGKVTSESMAYGMLITAAMGDRTAFDGLWYDMKGRLSGGLFHWEDGSNGSATDADADISYALMVAGAQWGGSYASDGATMVSAMNSQVVINNRISAGSNWSDGSVFNASYHTPAWYPIFGGSWASTISQNNYSALNACDSSFGGSNGLVPDWCNGDSGAPTDPVGTVQNELSCDESPNRAVFGFDAARVPWRMGQDKCLRNNSSADSYVNRFNTLVGGRTNEGLTVHLMKAGYCRGGGDATGSIDNQMSFIGSVGVSAMGAGNTVMRDTAMRAVLDIIESPEFNRTYYPTTLGMLTLLDMTGNFPHL